MSEVKTHNFSQRIFVRVPPRPKILALIKKKPFDHYIIRECPHEKKFANKVLNLKGLGQEGVKSPQKSSPQKSSPHRAVMSRRNSHIICSPGRSRIKSRRGSVFISMNSLHNDSLLNLYATINILKINIGIINEVIEIFLDDISMRNVQDAK